LNAGRAPRLCEEHRAELAGADQQDTQRLAIGGALQEQVMKIQGLGG
jgi:hypothetical protein